MAVVLALGAVPVASAAGPYYVSPAGTGFDCSPASRCALENAASLAGSGEQILMAPGSYNLSGNLSLTASLMPETPGTRPEIHTNLGRTISLFGANSVIRDLRFNVSGLPPITYALNLQAATARAERVEVIASGDSSPFAGAALNGAVFADSVLSATGPNSVAVATGNSGATLRNVTAVAAGSDSIGLFTNPSYMGPTPAQVLTIQNSIVRGDAYGFYVYADPTHSVTVNVDHSNYPATNVFGAGALLSDPGPTQTAAPAFVAPLTGDFHQLAGSPTVNAGAAVAGLSATDLDGRARNQGGAPDIGADEFEVGVPPTGPPPTGTPTTGLSKKCKKPKKKSAASAAPVGVQAKKCKKKKR